MPSKVFFHDARAGAKRNRLEKIKALFRRARMGGLFEEGEKVAVKIHRGEPGNVGYIPPPYIRVIVDLIKESGGVPFVTDTNTLYVGMRRNAIDNLRAAAMNGFTPQTLGAPVIVADGLVGRDQRVVETGGAILGEAKIAGSILDADSMIVVSHVKSHMLFGFGGTLKNLGMGCATPAGKQILHSDLRPQVDESKCEGDAICLKRCPVNCIEMVAADAEKPRGRKIARIDKSKCIGCGECTAACPYGAIPILWETSADAIMAKTAEYANAAVVDKKSRVGYFNLIIQVTPDCDCCDWNDTPFVPDVGFAASRDPVALDQASVDLVAKTPPSPMSKAENCSGDPWRAVYDIEYARIMHFAEELGMGTRQYELVRL